MSPSDSRTSIPRTVSEACRKYGLTRIIIGLSGGADSVALLMALKETSGKDIDSLTAIHCNFHLRGEESDRDELFCRDLCAEIGVDLIVHSCPVSEWRKTNRGSDEMACREMRYSAFREIMEKTGADAIAVAHNADDNIETFFLNLMRGAGLTGLGGMNEFRNSILRPLLSISRKEIETYLEEIGRKYIVDSTNMDSLYRRNFIRNKVLPLFEEEWPEARGRIRRSMDIIKAEKKIADFYLASAVPEGSTTIDRKTVKEFPDPVSVFRKFLEPFDVSSIMIREIAGTAALSYSGRTWNTGRGITIFENRDGWEIKKDDSETSQPVLIKEEHPFSDQLLESIKKAPHTVFWTETGNEFEWRKWKKGDRIKPLGMKGSSLVSDILSDNHVSRSQKAALFVLTVPGTSDVVWIPGFKRSRLFLVKPSARSVTRYYIEQE